MDLVQQSHDLLPQEAGAVKGMTARQLNGHGNHTNGHADTNGHLTNGHKMTNGHNKMANGHAPNPLDAVPRYEHLIGDTPMVDLTALCSPASPGVKLLAKCEFLNPGFSMKDRIIKNILDKAEASGELRPGGTVVAASSGNTGAAVAMLAAMRGYKAVITTSPKCSQEKMDAIRAYGAELIVSPPGKIAISVRDNLHQYSQQSRAMVMPHCQRNVVVY